MYLGKTQRVYGGCVEKLVMELPPEECPVGPDPCASQQALYRWWIPDCSRGDGVETAPPQNLMWDGGWWTHLVGSDGYLSPTGPCTSRGISLTVTGGAKAETRTLQDLLCDGCWQACLIDSDKQVFPSKFLDRWGRFSTSISGARIETKPPQNLQWGGGWRAQFHWLRGACFSWWVLKQMV